VYSLKKPNIFNLEKNKIDQTSGYFDNIIIGFRYTYFGNQLVYEQQKKLNKCLFSPLDLMTYEKKSHDNIIFNWHNRIGFCTVKDWAQFYDRKASCSYFRFLLEFVLLELLFFLFCFTFVFSYFFCVHQVFLWISPNNMLLTTHFGTCLLFLTFWSLHDCCSGHDCILNVLILKRPFVQCMIKVLNLFVFLNYQMWTYPIENQVPMH